MDIFLTPTLKYLSLNHFFHDYSSIFDHVYHGKCAIKVAIIIIIIVIIIIIIIIIIICVIVNYLVGHR